MSFRRAKFPSLHHRKEGCFLLARPPLLAVMQGGECHSTATRRLTKSDSGFCNALFLSFALQISGLTVLLFSLMVASAAAQQPQSKPDISGFWELRFDSKNVPRASLDAKVTPKDIEAHRQKDLMAIRWCNFLGVPALMEQSPLDIRQGRVEIAIAAQPVSVARHIYTDGRGHVNPDIFDPTTN